MSPAVPTELHGIPVAVDVHWVDRNGGKHRFIAAGPFLRCVEHTGTIQRDNVVDALAALSNARTCDRMRIAWQRLMLADDEHHQPVMRVAPKALLAYLEEQTQRHARRLDAALGPVTNKRVRRRWHNVGWRATPSLAARFQRAGVEAGIAFVAMRNNVAPEDVQRAASDPKSPVGAALRDAGHDGLKLLNLGVRQLVTHDFAYEPLDSAHPTLEPPTPTPTDEEEAAHATPLPPTRLAPPGTAVPVLPSADLDRTIDFYGRIGFRLHARHPALAILVRDTIELQFSHVDVDPKGMFESVFVRVWDAVAIHDEVLLAHPDIVRCNPEALNAEEQAQVTAQRVATGSRARVHGVRPVPWGGHQFALVDPDGNLLQFGEAGVDV
jgi:catechol 2,3-dioxygenase-like lactoylglutathione lyase family enzyme